MILLDTKRTAATPNRRLVVVAVAVEFDCLARLKSSSTRSGWSRSSSSKEFSWARRSIGSKERIVIVNISGSACDWRCLWPAESWNMARVVWSALRSAPVWWSVNWVAQTVFEGRQAWGTMMMMLDHFCTSASPARTAVWHHHSPSHYHLFITWIST